MFSLFDLFGRSAAVKALDHALREAGLHPLLVPEAVKLTMLQLQKKHPDAQAMPPDAALAEAAQLLAYCFLGHAQFAESHDAAAAARAEERLDAAIEAGDSLDAKIVLLALHAGRMAPDIADRIDIEGD